MSALSASVLPRSQRAQSDIWSELMPSQEEDFTDAMLDDMLIVVELVRLLCLRFSQGDASNSSHWYSIGLVPQRVCFERYCKTRSYPSLFYVTNRSEMIQSVFCSRILPLFPLGSVAELQVWWIETWIPDCPHCWKLQLSVSFFLLPFPRTLPFCAFARNICRACRQLPQGIM